MCDSTNVCMLMAQGEKDTIYQSHSSVRYGVFVCGSETLPTRYGYGNDKSGYFGDVGFHNIYIYTTFPRVKHTRIHCKDLGKEFFGQM